MLSKSNSNLAEERASAYAPLPKYRAPQAGGIGVMLTLFVAIIYGALAGVYSDVAYWPTLGVLLLGFSIPYLYVKSIEKKHFKACAKEYAALEATENAPKP